MTIKTIKKTLINLLPHSSKYWIEKLKLIIHFPSLILGKKQAVEKPIVLISFPRSGSSWVGAMLGAAPNTLYMREPITTPYMLVKPNRLSVFEAQQCENWQEYKGNIHYALNGKAKKLFSIAKYPQQWQTPNKHKRLLIKEVNPLVINEFINGCAQVVYLVRHPFAIVKSYQALNWHSNDQFSKRLSNEQLSIIKQANSTILQQSIHQQLSYLLGWVEAKTKHALTDKRMIIRYEDICQHPIEQFQQLFKQVDLEFSSQVEQSINHSLSAKHHTEKGQYSLKRNRQEVGFVNIKRADENSYLAIINNYLLAIEQYNNHYNCYVEPSYTAHCSLISWLD